MKHPDHDIYSIVLNKKQAHERLQACRTKIIELIEIAGSIPVDLVDNNVIQEMHTLLDAISLKAFKLRDQWSKSIQNYQGNSLDGEPYWDFSDQCMNCKHLTEGWASNYASCAAFELIPPEIWNGEVSHKKPYPGDGGIQFEQFVRDE